MLFLVWSRNTKGNVFGVSSALHVKGGALGQPRVRHARHQHVKWNGSLLAVMVFQVFG
jgi:hypothetical protein